MDQIGPKPEKAVADEPMLRNYWTEFDDSFTKRRAVVWNGAVLDFISIRALKFEQIICYN